jgi:hypothetical protein
VEEEDSYYDIADGPRTGVLLLSSPTMSSGRLGNTVFFELEKIDDEEYFNTNDLVRVNEDGSLTCIGRSNKFFVNNAGVRFDAGLVENAVSSQPGIVACGVVPELHKTLHDNIPVLYAQTGGSGAAALATLRKALIQVFIKDDMLADTNMPGQCVLTDSIPLNSSGKVDSRILASGSVTGQRFSVKSVKVDGRIQDILLIQAAEGELATMGAGIPEELEGDPYTILSEVFAAIPDIQQGRFSKVLKIPGLRELVKKLTDFDIGNVPASMRTMTPKMLGLAFRKYLTPMMKGDYKMSKKNFNGSMPMFQAGSLPVPPMPVMPFMPFGAFGQGTNQGKVGENRQKQKENIKSTVKTAWMQKIDRKKTSADNGKEQWRQFFDYLMEMQETFCAALPDDTSSMPYGQMLPMSPKAFMERVKDFQKMANEHFVEQADSFADFWIKGQEQLYDMVSSAMESKDARETESADEAKDADDSRED